MSGTVLGTGDSTANTKSPCYYRLYILRKTNQVNSDSDVLQGQLKQMVFSFVFHKNRHLSIHEVHIRYHRFIYMGVSVTQGGTQQQIISHGIRYMEASCLKVG